jgi:hypothetical protein
LMEGPLPPSPEYFEELTKQIAPGPHELVFVAGVEISVLEPGIQMPTPQKRDFDLNPL